MEQLLEQSAALLDRTDLKFKRYLLNEIRWKNRLIGVKGARGTGKTTLLLQWLKEQQLSAKEGAYFSLDDLYFTQHSLKETLVAFYKQGGKVVVIDEVHKYRNWSTEIKNVYDFFPDLKIVFTGSSIIDISKQQADLSRRAVMYELPGLSYREFLAMRYGHQLPVVLTEQIVKDAAVVRHSLPKGFRPLQHFEEYLQVGYYPFVLEDDLSVYRKIQQLSRTIVETDLAELPAFDIRNARKLLQLLYIVAQQVPFKPNLTTLAEKTGIHSNSLNNYLLYLEQARLVTLLETQGRSTAVLQKPEKIYLQNTNQLFALAEDQVEKGNLRETFFLSQVSVAHRVSLPKEGDFILDDQYTFELGGKGKSGKQISGKKNAFVVKDDLELPVGHALPLWMFGMMY